MSTLPVQLLKRSYPRAGNLRRTRRRAGRAFRPRLEPLEERQAPAVLAWTGLGENNRWSAAANWDRGQKPAAGDQLRFPNTATQKLTIDDIGPTAFGKVSIEGAGYRVDGAPGTVLSVTNGIEALYDAGESTLNLPVVLTAGQNFWVNEAKAILKFGQPIDVAGNTLLLTGSGSVSCPGIGDSTGGDTGDVRETAGGTLAVTRRSSYNGSITLIAGTVAVDDQAALGTGTLVVQAGSVTAPTILKNTLGPYIDTSNGTVTLTDVLKLSNRVRLDGAALQLEGSFAFQGDMTVAAASTLAPQGSYHTTTLNGAVHCNDELTIDGPAEAPVNFAGVVDGTSSVTAVHRSTVTVGGTLSCGLVLNDHATGVLKGSLGGTGAVQLNGFGTLVAPVAMPNYCGTVTLQGGTVEVGQAGALGTGTISVHPDGGSVLFQNISPDGRPAVLPNAVSLQGGTLSLEGGFEFAGTFTAEGPPGAAHPAVLAPGDGRSAALLHRLYCDAPLLVDAAASSRVAIGLGSSVIDGIFPVHVVNNSTVVIQGTLNGDVTVEDMATLQLGDAAGGALVGTGKVRLNSGTLRGGDAGGFSGEVDLSGGAVELNGDRSLGTGTVVVSGQGTGPLLRWPSGWGGSQALVLPNPVSLQGEALSLQGSFAFTGEVTVAGPTRLALTGDHGPVVFQSTVHCNNVLTLDGPSAAPFNFRGTIDGPSSVRVVNNSRTQLLGATLSAGVEVSDRASLGLDAVEGSGPITVRDGTLVSMGSLNRWSGRVELRGGNVQVGADTALGTGVLTVSGPGPVRIEGATDAYVYLKNASVLFAKAPAVRALGALKFTGPAVMDGGMTVELLADPTLTFAGPVSGGGDVTFGGAGSVGFEGDVASGPAWTFAAGAGGEILGHFDVKGLMTVASDARLDVRGTGNLRVLGGGLVEDFGNFNVWPGGTCAIGNLVRVERGGGFHDQGGVTVEQSGVLDVYGGASIDQPLSDKGLVRVELDATVSNLGNVTLAGGALVAPSTGNEKFPTITVNSVADYDAPRSARDNQLTLREAIELANGRLAYGDLTGRQKDLVTLPDQLLPRHLAVIAFNIPDSTTDSETGRAASNIDPGSGIYTIHLRSSLPQIAQPVAIDGYSQPGAAWATAGGPARLKVELDGTDAGDGAIGVVTLGAGAVGCTIQGLVIDRFRSAQAGTALENNGFGIWLSRWSASTNVWGNFIGTDAAGQGARANAGNGISVQSLDNVIGGPSPWQRNVISGNGGPGITLGGEMFIGQVALDHLYAVRGVRRNVIQGNYIGVNASGNAPVPNHDGILIADAAYDNVIGGSGPGDGNVISGNANFGIFITEKAGDGNIVRGNFIGTDATGKAALGNGGAGIAVYGGTGAMIGGPGAADGNVIAANGAAGTGWPGVGIYGKSGQAAGVAAGATDVTVQNNSIGTGKDGKSTALGNRRDGVLVSNSPNNHVLDNVISGNGASGLMIYGAGARGNDVQGNWIGTDGTGLIDLGNGNNGITIQDAPGNRIGGARRNVISGNDWAGIRITGPLALSNVVRGNVIGAARLANEQDGVQIVDAAAGNTIGGSGPDQGNTISGNGRDGIRIQGAGATLNVVSANTIGTDASGTVRVANGGNGIEVVDAVGNILGGAFPDLGNVVSGNTGTGILISGAAAHDNLVQNNYVGTDRDGRGRGLGNQRGVAIEDAPHNFIGGRPSARSGSLGNLIADNRDAGVFISGTKATGNVIQGNVIGRDSAGVALGNQGPGVSIVNASDTIIGEEPDDTGAIRVTGAANTISANRGDGVRIAGNDATGNLVRGNVIYRNTGLGINLVGGREHNGITANHEGVVAGPNHLTNFPVGVTAWYDASRNETVISGVLSAANPQEAVVDVYANARPNDLGFGDGLQFLGSVRPNETGAFFLSLAGTLPAGRPFLCATATDEAGSGSTSEFGPCYGDPVTPNVVCTAGDGIPDVWKRDGIDFDGDGIPDLSLRDPDPKHDANPRHKDLYVEVDWMHGFKPEDAALDAVKAAFARAPFKNPDGTPGITLHINPDGQGNEIDHTEFTAFAQTGSGGAAGFGDLKDKWFGQPAEHNGTAGLNTLRARNLVYRYCLFVDKWQKAPDVGGESLLWARDFMVSLGGWSADSIKACGGLVDVQAGTFMHELGHTLGLNHAGPIGTPQAGFNYKPNYLSLMNYSFACRNVINRPLDYSRYGAGDLVTLNKAALDESQGIGGAPWMNGWLQTVYYAPGTLPQPVKASTVGPIDWNFNGAIDAGPVASDVNGSGTSGILQSQNDWAALRYDFRPSKDDFGGWTGTNSFGGGDTGGPDLTREEALAAAKLVDADGDGIPNAYDNEPFVANPDQADSTGDGIGDAGRLRSITLSTGSVYGGASLTGTVTLLAPSPQGPVRVDLWTSDLGVADVPAFVLIPAGARTATFTLVTAPALDADTPVTVYAGTWGVTLTADLSVRVPPTIADLEVSQTGPRGTVPVGEPVTYTLTVTNHGPDAQRGVVVTDTLPPGVLLSSTPQGQVLKVTLDYTYDTHHFFDTQAKKDLMQLAADTMIAGFGDSLAAITPGGTNTWNATFGNPAQPQTEAVVSNLTVGANELRIYVGGADLGPANTDTPEILGKGWRGGAQPSGSAAFLQTVEARGQAGALGSSPTDFGPWGGSISFNTNPGADFYFGLDPSGIEPGQADFLTVAMHEMGHVLGIGTAPSWDTYVSAADPANPVFTGPASVAEYGQNVPLAADEGHWKHGILDASARTLMDPLNLRGQRVPETALDRAGLRDVGWGSAPDSHASQTVTWDLGTLQAGQSTTLTVTVVPSASGLVTNLASIAGAGIDPDTGNNVAAVNTTVSSVLPSPLLPGDLEVSQVQPPASVVVGQPLTFTLTVTNHGPGAQSRVILTDALLSDAFQISDAGAGRYDKGQRTVTWDLGTLQAGQSATVRFTITPLMPGQITNLASVAGDGSDPNPGNNESRVYTGVVNAITVGDLEVAQAQPPRTVNIGEGLTYSLTVTNHGPDPRFGVTLTDALPRSAAFSSASGGGQYNASLQSVTWEIDTLDPGQSMTFTVTVFPWAPGTISNAARVGATPGYVTGTGGIVWGSDPNPDNDVATVSSTVTAAAGPIVVNTTADQGDATHTSLRDAINVANRLPGPTTIDFNIPGSGVHTITPSYPLPAITRPVIIDGYSQPGASVNTLPDGDNAVLRIELVGYDSGLVIEGGNSTVRGLVINGSDPWGDGLHGNAIMLLNKGGNVIQGNFLGTDPTGTQKRPNARGVVIGSGSAGNLVGTDGDGVADPAERNLISGNNGRGVWIVGTGSDNNVVAGNFIGTDASGTRRLSNWENGIVLGSDVSYLPGSPKGSRIGINPTDADPAAERNIISGNDGHGVAIAGASDNIVSGNFIGTDVTGTHALGNAGWGVLFTAAFGHPSSGNRIGTTSGSPLERNLISGNGNARTGGGVGMGGVVTNNIVAGNFIGTDVSGTTALANKGQGVGLFTGATGNTIGGVGAGAGNLISGNSGSSGVYLGDSGNIVQGNFIGTDVAGTRAISNVGNGIDVWGNNNTVGGSTVAARNLISGNLGGGIVIGASRNLAAGNFVGTDVTGGQALGNGANGVTLHSGAQNNIVGGTTAAARNVISGNGVFGVALFDAGTTANAVLGNYIGTNLDGTTALGNGHGIGIGGASGNTVGGTADGAGNLIAGNLGWGVRVDHANGTVVQGNRIGTNWTGRAAMGNAWEGVSIASSSSCLVGGTAPGAGNIIAFNRNGVAIDEGGPATGDAILANAIFSNAPGLGINFNGLGVVANDSRGHAGPNNFQNFPVLTAAFPASGATTIQGMLQSTANTVFRLEFFANPAADPSGFGQGKTFLGSTTVTTDDSGNATFAVTFPVPVPTGEFITATATDANNNTSEFAKDLAVGLPGQLAPPVLSLAFDPEWIWVGDAADLSFTISNPSANAVDLSGVALTDTLPEGLTVADGSETVGGGLLRFGGASISLSGASIPAGGQLQFSVDVTGAVAGDYTDTTGVVTSANGGAGNVAWADLTVYSATGPTAMEDLTTTPEQTPVTIDVLANDIDPVGALDPSSLTVRFGPAHGFVTVQAGTGSITYTPVAGFRGVDHLLYEVSDTNGASATAVVRVLVTPVDHPPVARDDEASTPEGVPVRVNVLANDADPDGDLDPARVTVVAAPAHGTTAIDPASGAVTYSPGDGFTGLDRFTYRVADRGGLADTAVVSVQVVPHNYPPVCRDDSADLGAATAVRINVLANDSDPDDSLDPASVRIVRPPVDGVAVVNSETGEVTYAPGPTFSGIDRFTYAVSDTRGSWGSATVTVQGPIAHAVQPPVVTPLSGPPPAPPVIPTTPPAPPVALPGPPPVIPPTSPVPPVVLPGPSTSPVVPPVPAVAPVVLPLPLPVAPASGGGGEAAPENFVTATAQPAAVQPATVNVILLAVARATPSGGDQEEPAFWPWLLEDVEEQPAPPEAVASLSSGPELASRLREVLYEPARAVAGAAADAFFSRLALAAAAPADGTWPDESAANREDNATDPEPAPWYLWGSAAAALLGVSNGPTRRDSERKRVPPVRRPVPHCAAMRRSGDNGLA